MTARKAKPYFILATFDRDFCRWIVDFGAFDKADVKSEMQDRRDHFVKAKDLKIIKCESVKQADVDAAMLALNAGDFRTEYRALTKEEDAALIAFAAAHGKKWKDTLASVYWFNARVWSGGKEGMGTTLHYIRNTLGGSWLLDVYELPNPNL